MKYLVRDCLDYRVLDREREPVGHVDDVVIAISGDRAPRVVAVEIGSVARARRIGRRFERWASKWSARWGRQKPNPYRIAWGDLSFHLHDVRIDASAADLPPRAWETWLRERVIARLPGGSGE